MTGANPVRSAVVDDVLDDLFHGCALAAFVEQAKLAEDWPNPEQVRRRACNLYDKALAERSTTRECERCHETVTLEAGKVR